MQSIYAFYILDCNANAVFCVIDNEYANKYEQGARNLMSEPRKDNDLVNDLSERARDLWEQGGARHVVLRTAEGRQLLEVPLNWTVVALFSLFFISGGWMILLVSAIIGFIAKMRVEIVRDIDNDDDVVEINRD